MRWKGWILLAAGTAAGWWFMQRAQAAPAPAPASFDGMDADHDGGITPGEHAVAAAGMFRTMDRNRDGKVDAAEMEAAQARVTGRPAAPGDLPAAKKIAAVDANGDGVLSAAEHSDGAEAMFAAMDTDHDGRVDRQEFEQARSALHDGDGGGGGGGGRKAATTGR